MKIGELNLHFIPCVNYYFLCKSDSNGKFWIIKLYTNLIDDVVVSGIGEDGLNYKNIKIFKEEYENFGPIVCQISKERFEFLWLLWRK